MDSPGGIIHRPAELAQAPLVPTSRNPFFAYIASLEAPRSRRTQRSSLGHLTRQVWGCEPEDLCWQELRFAELSALKAWLSDPKRYKPATANRLLSGIRRVLYFARRLGLMGEDAYRECCDVGMVRGSRLVPGRAVTHGELQAMFRSLDVRKPLDARNAALLALLYGAGLRRDEACRLELADLDVETGALRVMGKGNKERVSHLPKGARAAVKAWLVHRGRNPGPLLLATEHGRELTGRAMACETVAHAIAKIGQRAGVPHFSPHDLRRTWVGDMLRENADLVTVQTLAGHASPDTTSRYDRRGDAERATAAELVCVPFVGVPEETQEPQS